MEDEDIPARELSEWQPVTDKATTAVLGKLGEEATEDGGAIFRCLIQGLDEQEPVTGKVNRHWLEDEIADVLAMLDHVQERLDLDVRRIGHRRRVKYKWKATWFDSFDKGA